MTKRKAAAKIKRSSRSGEPKKGRRRRRERRAKITKGDKATRGHKARVQRYLEEGDAALAKMEAQRQDDILEAKIDLAAGALDLLLALD